jgi:hypothetical protein
MTETVHVTPGVCTSIVLEKTIVQTLPPPYGTCKQTITGNESILVSQILSHELLYRKANCKVICNQLYNIKQCGCRPQLEKDWFKTKACTTEAELRCATQISRYFETHAYGPDCDDLCPLECEITTYKHTQFTHGYPSQAWASYLSGHQGVKSAFAANNLSYSYGVLKASAVCVNVYFNELQYTLMTDSPRMTFLDLVSNIGGLMGLFLGMSLLSLIEYVEIFIEIVAIFFGTKIQKSTRASSVTLVEGFKL